MELLDVSYLQTSLAGVLVDVVKVTTQGEPGFDYETGETVETPGALVYEGAGAVIPLNNEGAGVYPHTPNSTDGAYRLLLPVTCEGIVEGLNVQVVSSLLQSQRDPEITQRWFKTKAPAPVTSFPVFKIIDLEEIEGE